MYIYIYKYICTYIPSLDESMEAYAELAPTPSLSVKV